MQAVDTLFIQKYFQGEKQESLLFIAVSLLAILVSLFFFFQVRRPFYTGMAWPMITISAVLMIVGIMVYSRAPKDIARVISYLDTDASKLDTVEIPRMKKVMKNFEAYRWIEFGLMVAGLVVILANKEVNFWKGLGAGIFMMATIALLFDFFAERRGKVYLEKLISTLSLD